MADREKVIRKLQDALENAEEDGKIYAEIRRPVVFDTIALLKEQETEWEHLWDAPDGTFKGRCKKCGYVHFFIGGHNAQYKFCPECGRSVKWE